MNPIMLLLEVGALRRLGELLVGRSRHIPSDLDQDCFHCKVSLPEADAREFRQVDLEMFHEHLISLSCLSSSSYLPRPLIHARQIHFAYERNLWWQIGIVRPTDDFERVYSILVHALHPNS